MTAVARASSGPIEPATGDLPAPPPWAAQGLGREVAAFAIIGIVSTAAYAGLYLVLRLLTGPVIANAAALVVTAIGNTTANRRTTFGVRGRESMVRHQLGGLLALAVALAVTTVSVSGLAVLVPDAPRALELAVLVGANALATVARFTILRTLIRDRHPSPTPGPASAGSRRTA